MPQNIGPWMDAPSQVAQLIAMVTRFHRLRSEALSA